MGIVYEAEQESLGRRVAVKVLPGSMSARPQAQEPLPPRSPWPPTCTTPTLSRSSASASTTGCTTTPCSSSRAGGSTKCSSSSGQSESTAAAAGTRRSPTSPARGRKPYAGRGRKDVSAVAVANLASPDKFRSRDGPGSVDSHAAQPGLRDPTRDCRKPPSRGSRRRHAATRHRPVVRHLFDLRLGCPPAASRATARSKP